MSNDPVGFKNVHNFNRYAYANNNPYKYVDPDGKESRAAIRLDHRVKDLANGRITEAQYREAAQAEAIGAGVGLALAVMGTKEVIQAGVEAGTGVDLSYVPSVKNGTKAILKSIEQNGFKVTFNPKNAATKQEVNATIDFGNKTKVNLRVESHPLKPNGPDVRHANVEVTNQVKNKNKVVSNKHIIDK